MLPVNQVENAAFQFLGAGQLFIHTLGNGLIHNTYLVSSQGPGPIRSIVLQAINQSVFKEPEDVLHNYGLIYEYLRRHQPHFVIPAPVRTMQGTLLWRDEDHQCWRATEYLENSHSPTAADSEEAAYEAAKCFAALTHALDGIDTTELKVIIPDFHNLSLRFGQMESSIVQASLERLMKSTHLIAELRQRRYLVLFYEGLSTHRDFPDRVMHHDCKISNILFDTRTGLVLCPVDLDTLMPGKFFSDLGDMIRSMAACEDENSTHWENIKIRPTYYKAIAEGYLESMHSVMTKAELGNIHAAGLLMIYMQSMRFLTDYLNNDRYYKTTYPEQNLNRALNQLILLESLESFLQESCSYRLGH
jgi:hypothetical protein